MTKCSPKYLLVLVAISATLMAPLVFAQTADPSSHSAVAAAAAPMQDGSTPATAPASTDKPKTFKELDVNKDGKLSKDEIAADPTWAPGDFDNADTNKDGFISRAEFKKFKADMKKMNTNNKAAKVDDSSMQSGH